MKIQREQVDMIRNMYSHELESLLRQLGDSAGGEFVECIKYELSARRNGAQCDCDECYRADGWEIVD